MNRVHLFKSHFYVLFFFCEYFLSFFSLAESFYKVQKLFLAFTEALCKEITLKDMKLTFMLDFTFV